MLGAGASADNFFGSHGRFGCGVSESLSSKTRKRYVICISLIFVFTALPV